MSERDYNELWAIAPEQQSAYGSALLDATCDTAYPWKDAGTIEEDIEFRTNEDQVGVGEFPTDQEIEYKDLKLTRQFDLGSWMAGWIASFGLGACSSAQQGGTSAYLHTITPQTAQQLTATTIIAQQSAGIKNKMRDICVARFKISGEGKQRLQLSADFVGSGHIESSSKSMPSLSADSFLRMHGVTFEVGVADSEVDVSARLKRFEYEWDNHPLLDDGYHPGSGQVRGRLHHGRRTQSLTFDVLMDENAVERTHLLANNALKAIITAQGAVIEDTYYHQLVITVHKLKYRKLPISSEDNMRLYRIELNPLYDSAVGNFVTIAVTNTQTAYLGAEA